MSLIELVIFGTIMVVIWRYRDCYRSNIILFITGPVLIIMATSLSIFGESVESLLRSLVVKVSYAHEGEIIVPIRRGIGLSMLIFQICGYLLLAAFIARENNRQ